MSNVLTSPVPAHLEGDAAECVVEAVTPANCPFYQIIKRCFDFFAALIIGSVLLLPLLVIGLLIRIESPGPAIFRQERMGEDGKSFMIYKFRTMRINAPPELAAREFVNSDAYITKIGAVLRRTSIDELPQLLNILRGEMSFVGYRPVCLSETKLNELRRDYGVFAVRPGLTGYAQICGRDNVDYQQKAALDAEYVSKYGIRMDLWCLIKTVDIVFTGEGVN